MFFSHLKQVIDLLVAQSFLITETHTSWSSLHFRFHVIHFSMRSTGKTFCSLERCSDLPWNNKVHADFNYLMEFPFRSAFSSREAAHLLPF